jgi:hypothetical protein
MSADLVSVSLSIHGAVFIASVAAIWKLGGESKFGAEKINDLHALRPKVLKATVTALELTLNPVLTSGDNIESLDVDESGNPKPKPARLNVDGKEALTNAVRDFVKAKSAALVDLCHVNALDNRLTRCMRWLRHLVSALSIVTIIFCGLMGTAKLEWTSMTNPLVHGVGFALIASLVFGSVLLFCSILHASSKVDELKSRYADLPN